MVEPRLDWAPAVQLAETKLGAAGKEPADYRKIYVYDCCGRCDRPSLSGKGYRQFPHFDAPHFEQVSQSVLQEDEKGKSLFGENDIFFTKDGRRTATTLKIQKVLRSAAKDQEGFNKKPVSSPFRLVYSNQEFGPEGYANMSLRAAGAGRACLPDLLETAFFLTKKAARTPVRQRKWLEVPGTNACRGLSGLSLKSSDHFGIQVSPSTLKAIQEATEAADARGDEAEAAPLELMGEGDQSKEQSSEVHRVEDCHGILGP